MGSIQWKQMAFHNRTGIGIQCLFFCQNIELTVNVYYFLFSKDSTLFAELGYFTDTEDLQLDAAKETYVSIH